MGGRIAALDVGKKKIGVAITDPLGIIASPWGFIKVESIKQAILEIQNLISEQAITKLVVGVPVGLSGNRGEQAEYTLHFISRFQEECDCPVEFMDERFSTKAAEASLLEGGVSRKKRKMLNDSIAASLILQTYISKMRNSSDLE